MSRKSLGRVRVACAVALGAILLASAPARADDGAAAPSGSLSVNAAGLLGFGLSPMVEFGGQIAGFARVRLFATGLLSYFLLADASEDEIMKPQSVSVGGGVHFFLGNRGPLRGFFVGPALEWANLVVEDADYDYERYTTRALLASADAGYRWLFGNFMLGAGGTVGWATVLSKDCERLPGHATFQACVNDAEDQAFIAAAVDVGFVF